MAERAPTRNRRARKSRLPSLRLIAFVLAGLGLAGAAMVDAAGNVFARRNPALALRLDDGRPRALAAYLDGKMAAGGDAQRLTASDEARMKAALARDPLGAALIRQIGIRRDLRGDARGAAQAMALAERVSRRDQFTQLWLIEHAVRRADIAGALHHYDVALTTSAALEPTLFPILATALSEPAIRAGLVARLRQRRFWTPAFIAFAQANAAPGDLAAVVTAAGLTRDPRSAADFTELLRRFTALGDLRGARAFAATLPDARPHQFDVVGFSAATLDQRYAPVSWELTDSDGIRAHPHEQGGVSVRVEPDTRGVALSRLLSLQPGRYALAVRSATSTETYPVAFGWAWLCVRGRARTPIGRQDFPAVPGERRLAAALDVPGGCGAVQLDLNVRSGEEGVAGVDIRELMLTRLPG